MRYWVSLLCALALLSCSRQPDPRQFTCNPVEGVEQVLGAPGVFIGDLHGTEESPAFLRDLSCHVMKSGRPLVVAMEYDARDQPVLDRFLQEADDETAGQLLTSTEYWQKNRDGRASTAMRDALLAIRQYARVGGGSVELLAYDLGVDTWQERDPASARYISGKRMKDGTNAYWIVFGGNAHARKVRGMQAPGYEDHEPLGYLIRDWNLLHLDAEYRGGNTWGCVGGPDNGTCSVIQLGEPCATDCPKQVVIRLGSRMWRGDAYDGTYDVGKLTASPPLWCATSAATGWQSSPGCGGVDFQPAFRFDGTP